MFISATRLLLALLMAMALPRAEAAPPADFASGHDTQLATAASGAERELAEQVTFLHNGRRQAVEGRVVAEVSDGRLLVERDDGTRWTIDRGELISRRQLDSIFRPLTQAELAERLLVETDDGTRWALERGELISRRQLDSIFRPLTQAELAERLLAELPPGFRIHTTPRYVVCYNTSRAYALWTSSLLERLNKAFTNYWEGRGLELREPEFPLAVVVFADRQTYDAASRDDLPGGTGNIIGYYSLRSNRVNMFDLTGVESLRGSGNRRGSLGEVNLMLSQPAAVPLVATVVHEATHQIAFNCGLAARYADIPLWLCEGMATYFEAPDLSSTRGWRGIGKVNHTRLATFRDNLPNWHDGAIERLLADDHRFRDPATAIDAYADAWALNYYLTKGEPAAYAAYLKALSQKQPLLNDDPDARLREFRQHFGDPRRLEREFLKHMLRLK